MTTPGGRRRRAEPARPTSDLARSRGVFVAGALGTVVLVVLLWFGAGAHSLATPGPLGRPHVGVACASCHVERGASATCGGCHAPHASVRPAHQNLAAAGALECGTCHAIHRFEAGIAFETSGAVSLFDTGFERTLSPPTKPHGSVHAPSKLAPTPSPASAATFVPLVSARGCAQCHDLHAAGDPASSCVPEPAGSFSLCFDEHRRPATHGFSGATDRDAVVERARMLARSEPVRAAFGAPRRVLEQAVPVALALGGALVSGFVLRRRGPLRPRKNPVRGAAPGAHRLPIIDAARCLGCHACVDACPYDALGIRRYVAVLERPDACCGAGPCVEACPNGSLTLVAGAESARGPSLTSELEVPERTGVFLAGDVSGGSLIRNAVRQGVAVARTVAARMTRVPRSDARREGRAVDLLVIGAGPAGLSAGLTARALGLSVLLLDQAGVAASIRAFSRQKLVLDAAAADDEGLPLWLGDAPKEELLERWQRAVRLARLDVREGVRASAVERSTDARAPYEIRAELRDGSGVGFLARQVLIAVGTRGTPRPLDVPVPEEAAGHVHYELCDARAFAGKRVIVVGLGDVAMESAIALAAQPNTDVTIVHRGSGFSRGARRNIDAVARLVAVGRVRLVLAASIRAVRAGSLQLEVAGAAQSLPYEAMFVHVGAVPARGLLENSGVCNSA